MKKLVTFFLFFVSCLAATGQTTFTPGTPPTPAKPAVMSIVLAAGASPCTLTGDTFPAKNIVVSNCTLGNVTIPGFVIPNTVVLPWAITIQVNTGTNVQTFILSVTANNPFTVQATVNAQPAVSGTF